jgi:Bacterial SH3 domain
MKYYLLIILTLVSNIVFGQSSIEFLPEIVQVFSSGNNTNELGLQVKGGDDTPGNAVGIFFSGDTSYILDSVNYRILYKPIDTISNMKSVYSTIEITDRKYLSRLWVDNQYIILGYNRVGPDSLYNTTIILKNYSEISNFTLKQTESLPNYEMYYYLCRIGNILYFQSRTGKYFGISIENGSKKLVLLNEDELRGPFRKSNVDRYSWTDNYFFDHDQLLSGSSVNAYKYFSSMYKFDSEKYAFIQDMEYFALPNGLYSFISIRELYIFNKDGELLKHLVISEKSNSLPSTPLSIAPSGSVYYLYADFSKNETTLFRIGPLSELKLSYSGTGGTINDDHVNIRENPDIKSHVITQINRNTTIRILDETKKKETIGGQTSGWIKVRMWDRTEGWVFGAFIDKDK